MNSPDLAPSRVPRLRLSRPLALALVALVAVLCSLAYALAPDQPTALAVPVPPVAVPTVSIHTPGTPAGRPTPVIAWAAPLAVTVTDGTLLEVSAADAEGTVLAGALADTSSAQGMPSAITSGTSWRSAASSLLPGMTYRVQATVADARGHRSTHSITATAAKAERYLHATISPGDNAVVGIGLPAIITLDQVVNDPIARAAVLARLTVTTVPAVVGAWRWMSGSELHYRAATYWASGTKITATANFRRLVLPDGTWGEGNHTSAWSVGRSFISTVDSKTNLMTATVDGKVVRIMKDSLGRPGYETYSGVHLVLEKNASIVMDSTTTGHALGDKDYYKETVLWTVRISYGGAFVHSAPWSVKDQGIRNVSHGCINLSPVDAEWFYGQALRGDIVDVLNTGVGPVRRDPGMSDWNYTFAEWQQA